MKELVQKEIGWYKNLIDDLKVIEFQTHLWGWLAVGDRIIKDHDKYDKEEWGYKRVENIAKDMGYSNATLKGAIKFARKSHEKLNIPEDRYLTLDNLANLVSQFSIENPTWKWVYNNWLPDTKREPPSIEGLIQHDKYNIIYADPPWKYWEGGYKNQSQHYETKELEDICQQEANGKHVSELGADHSLLFMWVTFPMLDQFMDVMKCWGYEYSTVAFTWIKSLKDGNGFAFGAGNWTRANAEICVLGKRESIPRQDASISQIIYTPKEEHSRKPAIVRDKIVQLVGDLPRIELYARQKTEGWDYWGSK